MVKEIVAYSSGGRVYTLGNKRTIWTSLKNNVE